MDDHGNTITIMTTSIEAWVDPDPREITKRFRERMGDKRISCSRLAAASGINRQSLSDKLDDKVQFNLPELMAVSRALERNLYWAVTGNYSGAPPRGEGLSPLFYDPLEEPTGGSETPIRSAA